MSPLEETWAPTPARWEYHCREALKKRFGWLWDVLAKAQGNVRNMKPHEQTLWWGREKAVREFNRIGQIRDEARQVRLYRKLWRELQ